MKQIFLFLLLLITFGLSAQRQLPFYNAAAGTLTQTGAGVNYVDVRINYSDQTGMTTGSTLDNTCVLLYFNTDENVGYELPILSVTTPSSTNPVVRVNITGFPALNGAINGQGVIYKKTSSKHLVPFVSNASNSLQQVIQEAMTRDLNDALVAGVDVSKYVGSGVPAFTPTTNEPKLAQGLASPYPFYAYNGSAWVLVGSGGGSTADTTTRYTYITRKPLDSIALHADNKIFRDSLAGGKNLLLNSYPTMDASGTVTGGDLFSKYDVETGVYQKVRADSLKGYIGSGLTANSVDSSHIKPASVSYSDLAQTTKDSLSYLYSPTSFSAISDTLTAYGLTANESVTNYGYASVNDLYQKFSTASSFSSSTEYGGWLANGASGDSIAVSAPFGVIMSNSIGEGHPAKHGRLHPNGVATFDPLYPDVSGQISYHLRLLTKYKWFNHGIGGQTSTQLLARFDRDVLAQTVNVGDGRGSKTLERKPFVCLIEVGINDVYGGISVATTKNNLTSMAQKCSQNGIYCIMLNVSGDVGITELQAKQVDSLNTWLAEGALTPYGVAIVDFNKFWRDPAYNDNGHGRYLADDIHLTPAGYDSLATYIHAQAKLPILKKVYIYNEIAPTNALTGFSRPTIIRVDTTTNYTISGIIDSFNITTPLIRDSVWFSIVGSTNVSGTTYSGFSHIRYLVENSLPTSSKRIKYFSDSNPLWQKSGVDILPLSITNKLAIGTSSTGGAFVKIKTDATNGGVALAIDNSAGTRIMTVSDNVRVAINASSTGGYKFLVNGSAVMQLEGNSSDYTFINGSNYQIYGSPITALQYTGLNTGGSGFTELIQSFTGTALTYLPHVSRGANYKVVYNKVGGANGVTLDVINNRIGVGTSSPQYGIDIDASSAGNPIRGLGLLQGTTTGTPDSIVSSASGVLKRVSIDSINFYAHRNGLDLTTVIGGLRVSRLTTTQRDAWRPSGSLTGDIIYNTTTGTYQIGDASTSWFDVKKTIKLANTSIAIPSITGVTTGSVDVTVAGAVVGQSVKVNPRSDISSDNVILGSYYVSAANTVKITFLGTTVGTNGNVSRSFDIELTKD